MHSLARTIHVQSCKFDTFLAMIVRTLKPSHCMFLIRIDGLHVVSWEGSSVTCNREISPCMEYRADFSGSRSSLITLGNFVPT